MEARSFFNLPQATLLEGGKTQHCYLEASRQYSIRTNWYTCDEQPMGAKSLHDLFSGTLPVIRQQRFLSEEECEKMVEVLLAHKIGIYDINHVWPRVGRVGISQTDYVHDKQGYFDGVDEANSLLDKWKTELGIDVVTRVMHSLRTASGMAVRPAREEEKDYFVGVIRAIDAGIQIHADFAPFEGREWEIGRIVAQISWNILLNPIPGGDTFIYDRQWQAPEDDLKWRKDYPKYAYDPRLVDGHAVKVVKPVPGDLYWINSRNFHEVKACDISKDSVVQHTPTRYTVSSFVGFVPAHDDEPDTIVMWS
ncbi:hypothetical protein F4778DRAFT_546752 [Xylariomycetidae sp. FL2044]|nr:hypothetical protein F4778DRAFT_546752 [Xylariomycetidae sp. FL2044]